MNATFKKVVKKNSELQTIDRFGITRMGRSWTVRLGKQNGKHRFIQKVYDDDFGGDRIQAFWKAVEIVRENRHKYPSTWQPKHNLIKGLVLNRQKSHNGKSYYWRWSVGYNDGSKWRSKSFNFWATGEIYRSYLAAVKFVMELGVDVDPDKVDDHFFEYIQKMDLDEIEERSDLNILKSSIDATVLKQKILNR